MSSPASDAMTTAPHGSWDSPIGLDDVLAAGVAMRELGGDGRNALWLESRPEEGSRMTLLRRAGDTVVELTPAPADVRARVNEYGGGSWAAGDGIVVWVDAAAQQVVGTLEGRGPVALTPADPLMRYAAPAPCAAFGVVLAVREDHTDPQDVVTSLVALPWPGGAPDPGTVLAAGHDFYADPAVRADGVCAWVQWDQPAMPWDGAQLVVARLDDDGTHLVEERVLVDGAGPDPASGIAVQHPLWAPDGSLLFMSDAHGWWDPWRWTGGPAAPSPSTTTGCGSPATSTGWPSWSTAR